jgi:hypothetical protein
MEQIEFPEDKVWDERREWFEGREAECGQAGAPAPSEQACALMIDLQAIFCAGAWAAVVILAAAVVDSQAREARVRDAEGHRGPVPGLDRGELRWLRDLRNRLVHEDRERPVISIEDQWTRRKAWERHARRAVEAAFAALYPGPG